MSLNPKLLSTNEIVLYNLGNLSSRSSLYSVPSLEWDRCRYDYPLRTRSLPRQRKRDGSRLYRTLSHSGFINSYIKDPEPIHYHIPRSDSCSTIATSYLSDRDVADRYGSFYLSANSIPQKCIDEVALNVVKVKEVVLPKYKIEQDEFVESQEFNEDNYLGDIDNNFSSNNTNNKTTIDNLDKNNEIDKAVSTCNDKVSDEKYNEDQKDVYRAEYAVVNDEQTDEMKDLNISIESPDGEYHSFSDDFGEVDYESPVKDLVGKDIRDYSVPIGLYCDDYNKKEISPKKSPTKRKEIAKPNILEPILEESKSSYDDSSNDSNVNKKIESTTDNLIEEVIGEMLTHIVNVDKRDENAVTVTQTQPKDKDLEIDEIDTDEITIDTLACSDNAKSLKDRYSSLSASTGEASCDSTAEFEKYEVIAEIISNILSIVDTNILDIEIQLNDNKQDAESEGNSLEVTESFSITQIINKLERNVNLNDTIITETSDCDTINTNKIVESIIYYIFNTALHICVNKDKCDKKYSKKVVTVVDPEDILYTTSFDWLYFELDNLEVNEQISVINIYNDDNDNDLNIVEFDDENTDMNSLAVNNDNTDDRNTAFIDDTQEASFTYYDMCNELNESKHSNIDEDTTEIAAQIVSYLLEKSFDTHKTREKAFNETYTVVEEELNTAFVESDFCRSSSPHRDVFDVCTESPIKHVTDSFIGDDLSVFYEKDDAILGSPFVRKANVLTMSQTTHKGGTKYWVSFDDNLQTEKCSRRPKFSEKQMPSFLVVDFDDKIEKIDCQIDNSAKSSSYTEYKSEVTDSASNYITCDSEFNSRLEISDRKEILLYNSRVVNKKLHSTWPPYEHTLYYRLISNFRLSQSLDLS